MCLHPKTWYLTGKQPKRSLIFTLECSFLWKNSFCPTLVKAKLFSKLPIIMRVSTCHHVNLALSSWKSRWFIRKCRPVVMEINLEFRPKWSSIEKHHPRYSKWFWIRLWGKMLKTSTRQLLKWMSFLKWFLKFIIMVMFRQEMVT